MTDTQVKAPGTGRVVRVIGPVVDVEFPPDQMPEILNALKVNIGEKDNQREITLEVELHVATISCAPSP